MNLGRKQVCLTVICIAKSNWYETYAYDNYKMSCWFECIAEFDISLQC